MRKFPAGILGLSCAAMLGWNAALRAGLSVRNYGFFCDLTRYSASAGAAQIPEDRTLA